MTKVGPLLPSLSQRLQAKGWLELRVSYESQAGEGYPAKLTQWLFAVLISYRFCGLSSSLAVGLRLPSVPCHVGLASRGAQLHPNV